MNEYQGKGGLNAIMEISSLSVQVGFVHMR